MGTQPYKEPFPDSGRVAAIDYGTVRMGVAVCDPDRNLASPLEVRAASRADANYFRELANDERISGFVVGLPIHCDGGESQKSRECRSFAIWLADETGRPVRLFDERFTTSAATERLQAANLTRGGKKKRVDAIAALVLLESFLEACRYRGEIAGLPVTAPATGGDGLH